MHKFCDEPGCTFYVERHGKCDRHATLYELRQIELTRAAIASKERDPEPAIEDLPIGAGAVAGVAGAPASPSWYQTIVAARGPA